jgi:hypothetical protein
MFPASTSKRGRNTERPEIALACQTDKPTESAGASSALRMSATERLPIGSVGFCRWATISGVNWETEKRVTGFKKCPDCGRLVAGENVTIDVGEYQRLLRDSDALKLSQAVQNFPIRSRSPIARNSELAAFIIGCRETMTLHQIAAACRAQFKGHSPSKSAVDRFLKEVRMGLKPDLKESKSARFAARPPP